MSSPLDRITNNRFLRGDAPLSGLAVRAQQWRRERAYNGPALPDNPFEPYSELQAQLIRKYAPGKSFVDVACMFRADGAAAFLAEESGATAVTGTDTALRTEKFLEREKATNSKIKFVQHDMNAATAVEAVGVHDVVYCCGLLYHVPDPHHSISQLMAMSSGTLILGTKTIPEITGAPGGAVYFPGLSEKQRMAYQSVYGADVTSFKTDVSFTANWFWGLTPSCLRGLVTRPGWRVVEDHELPWTGRYDDYVLVAVRD